MRRPVLDYVRAIQEADERWRQNCWLDGLEYWHGIQMDECAFPILRVDQASAHGMLSEQDRWAEDAGYSPFTLAVEIAALLAAAELASLQGEVRIAALLPCKWIDTILPHPNDVQIAPKLYAALRMLAADGARHTRISCHVAGDMTWDP
jgi:GH15 family glucan-1,4-alpha-glucosidase